MQNLIRREDAYTDDCNKFLFRLIFTDLLEPKYVLVISNFKDTSIHKVFEFEGTASGYRDAITKMDEITEKGYY